jgi:hypothetical protein
MIPKGRTAQTRAFYAGQLGDPRRFETQTAKDAVKTKRTLAEMYTQTGTKQPPGPPVQTVATQQGGMSPTAIIQLLAQEGFSGQDIPLMAATIYRESQGRPGAINPRGEYSQGLGQINTAPGANEKYRGRNLLDPKVNIQTVKEMFDQSGYFPWYGYSDNLPPRIEAMKNYLPEMIRTAQGMGLYTHQGPISFNPGGRYGRIILDV